MSSPKADGTRPPRAKPRPVVFDIREYVATEEVFPQTAIALDLDPKYGQMRKVDVEHEKELALEFEANIPPEIQLTVFKSAHWF